MFSGLGCAQVEGFLSAGSLAPLARRELGFAGLVRTAVYRIAKERWARTVRTEIPSSAAISRFERPAAINEMTSSCRPVKLSLRASGSRGDSATAMRSDRATVDSFPLCWPGRVWQSGRQRSRRPSGPNVAQLGSEEARAPYPRGPFGFLPSAEYLVCCRSATKVAEHFACPINAGQSSRPSSAPSSAPNCRSAICPAFPPFPHLATIVLRGGGEVWRP